MFEHKSFVFSYFQKVALVFVLVVAGVLLPQLFGFELNQVRATTFSASTTIAEDTPGTDNLLKLKKINNLYYSLYTSANFGPAYLKMATSTNGASWNVSAISDSASPYDFDFGYYTSGGYYYALTSNYISPAGDRTEIVITTSSDAITWSATSTVVSVTTEGLIFVSAPSSANFLSLAYKDKNSGSFMLATSTDGVDWTTSTIAENIGSVDGFVANGNSMHALYSSTSGPPPFTTSTEVYATYASSVDGGVTWSTTVIDKIDYEFYFAQGVETLNIDNNGNPGIVYYKIDAIDSFVWDGVDESWGGDGNVTTSIHYAKYSGSAWASSTVTTFPLAIVSTTGGLVIKPSLTFAGNNEAVFVGAGPNFYPYLTINTNTLDINSFAITQVSNKSLEGRSPSGAGVSIIFNTSTLGVDIAFIGDDGSGTDRDIFFTSSTVAVAPLIPTGLTATPTSSTQIDLSWNSTSGATSYILYRSTDNFSTTSTVTTTALTSYSDTGLTASTQYYYKVLALNEIGNGGASSAVNTTTLAGALPYNGNLPAVPADSKTKLIYSNGVYYLAFTSSTNGNYNVYITTSTNGVLGTWSEPQTNGDIIFKDTVGNTTRAYFDFEANLFGEYFGLVYYASGTMKIVFTSSTDTSSWSATTTIVSDLVSANGLGAHRRIDLDFSSDEEFAVVGFNDMVDSNVFYRTAYSTNTGVTWSAMADNSSIATANDGFFIGSGVSGSGASRVLHYAINHITGSPGATSSDYIIYASSTDNGTTWTTTTLATELSSKVLVTQAGFAIDSNGNPAIAFESLDDFVDGAATTSVTYYIKTNGVWSSSTVNSQITMTIGETQEMFAFRFLNSDKPAIVYEGNNLLPYYAVSTSTSPLNFTNVQADSTTMPSNSGVDLAYNNTGNELGVIYVNSSNQLVFVTSSLVLPPSIPSGLAATPSTTTQIDLSWDSVPGATSYVLYSATTSAFTVTNTVTSTANTSYSNTGLTANTTYYYKVSAVGAGGESSKSTAVNTTTLALSNSIPTATAIYPQFATNGTGLVTVTTTITDVDANTVTLYVDYSLDGGSTWVSSTLGTVSGDGTPTTSTGSIGNITSTVDGNSLTFTWDSLTDAGAIVTTTAKLRITPNDGTANGSTQTSANFTIDNLAPSAPTTITLSPTAEGTVIVWSDVVGASTYTVSTTAGTATTTSATTIEFTGLTPNTSYSYQVKATDGYGNVGSYSTVSSTYTLVSTPTAPTITAASSTILNVTVANGGATTYAVKIVTGVITKYLQADGTIGDSAVWLTYSQLGNGSATSTTGLIANTSYTVSVAGKNGDGVVTTYTPASAVYTLANQASAPTVGTPTTSTLPITIDVNSNPVATTYAVYNSTDSNYLDANGASTSTAVYSTTSTLGSSFAAIGLTPNTAYQFTVIARNGDGVNATTSTASTEVYTLANQASAPTVTASSTTALNLTINVNSNPAATTFAVYNSTDANYLDSVGVSTSTAVYRTKAQWDVVDATGLSANTAYQFTVVARNGDDTDVATSTASTAVYTLASPPSTVSATADSTTAITVSWSGGTASSYNVQKGSDSAVTGQTSLYQYTGLTCNTSYTFKVYGVNGDGVVTVSYGTVTQSTSACPSSGGVSSPAPTPPPAPTVASPATISLVVVPNTPQTISIGNTSHTVTVSTPSTNGQVTVTIQSDPITITLKPGEEQLVDTNKDNKDDIFIRYDSLDGDKIKLTLSAIEDLEFSINQALSTADSQAVTLYFNSPDASLVAISNSSDFINSSFIAYTPTKPWTLTPGNGIKTVYVKFRTDKGGTRDVSDTITLTNQAVDQVDGIVCPLTPEQSYKSIQSNSVYYITTDCTKRAFSQSTVFFTYFTSWNDVKTTTKENLDTIPNDTLGFMPWGPNYDPKYGALVKIVTDPKVYLLLNTEKYWITSELVFNALKYAWNWIEDIDARLLNKYTTGSEIIDTLHHPNYTLIKYANSNKVYRLEPSSAEATAGKQVKRWIADETTFNSLNFRWDRIVTINDTEVYEDGEKLGVEVVVNTQTAKYTFTSLLSLGSTGEEVKQLQIRLKELGYLDNTVTPTTNFGSATQQAVIKLQTEHNLTPALGYTGPGTRSVLNGN